MIFQHNVFFQRNQQLERAPAPLPRRREVGAAQRALPRPRGAPRAARRARHAQAGRSIAERAARPGPQRPDRVPAHRATTASARAAPTSARPRAFLPYTAMGRAQLDHLERCLDAVRADVGARRSRRVRHRARRRRDLHARLPRRPRGPGPAGVVSPTASAPPTSPTSAPAIPARGVAGFRADLNMVRDGFERFGLLDDRVRFLQGPAAATLADARRRTGRAAAHRSGRRRRRPGARSSALYDRIAVGGVVVVDDRAESHGRSEVDAFRAARGITAPLEPVDALGGRVAQGRAPRTAPARDRRPTTSGAHPPLAPAGARPTPIDLSVVVVFYNMRREAARTLHSLSRAYQEGIDDLDYEVIVVENGSDPDQRLGEDFVARLRARVPLPRPRRRRRPVAGRRAQPRHPRRPGPGLRVDDRRRARAHARRPALRPRRACRPTRPRSSRPSSGTSGPGQQGDAMDDGYDQEYEDRLFEAIEWPSAGLPPLRDRPLHRRPRLVRRRVGEQLHVRAAAPARAGRLLRRELLDARRRLREPRALRAARLVARRHRVHDPRRGLVPPGPRRHDHQPDRRRPSAGRASSGTASTTPSCGAARSRARASRSTTSAACRTRPPRRSKPRRMSTAKFAESAPRPAPTGCPTRPPRCPTSWRWAFTEAVWRSLPWTQHQLARPAGRRRRRPTCSRTRRSSPRSGPTCHRDRHRRRRARAVPRVDLRARRARRGDLDRRRAARPDRPSHPRLRYVTGAAHDAAVVDEVRGDRRRRGPRWSCSAACTDRVDDRRASSRPTRRSSRSAPTWWSPTRS